MNPAFLKRVILFLIVYMCECLCRFVDMSAGALEARRKYGFPGAGVIGGMSSGNQIQVLSRSSVVV